MPAMTQLRTHLEQNSISQADMARRVLISRPYMSQIVAGQKTPSLAVAVRIERETKGAVPVSSWFNVGAA